ncbi:endoplasmin-like [Amphiura filiformis]|uniref:endoplasmin-like n=1 Tax=Amphiura filiformis TaxID=82378 RepID=UPI003B21FD13
MSQKFWLLGLLGLLLVTSYVAAENDDDKAETVEEDIGKSREGSKTDDEVVEREEEAIKLDGLNVAQMKEIRETGEKHAFQAEVNRMMKLIINSLYRNKEIFLRELISNASDALDKIRLMSLTDRTALDSKEEMEIKIQADKDNHMLHITDSGVGMTKADLINNLGTIARSGTSEFFEKLSEMSASDANDLIGQFGVGFYSSFLVADRVVVTTKHNDDKQYIWESDSAEFTVAEDPRGNTLGRGTTVSLHLKEEAFDFLEADTIANLVRKYSQFINFPIYLWTSKTEQVEEPIEEEEGDAEATDEEKTEDEDVEVEDEETEDTPKTRKVDKTTWDWEVMNENKPIWTRNPKEIEDEEYNEFFRAFSKEEKDPLSRSHFTAEGEVTFRSILFVPQKAPPQMFSDYGKKFDHIKLFVRRVFITDDFEDMMPKYLNFVKGVVDSDDLPLNVSRETLQQHKLLKVIKKKLVRKTLDMIKKMDTEEFMEKFWPEYGTNIKLGIIEDHTNRSRLAKLVRFNSSNSDELTSLGDYLERMKEKQDYIYFMAGPSKQEVANSPFVERLLKRGYEVLYLTEAVDEYCIQSLPEFEGKKFANVAKEGLKMGEESEAAKTHREEVEAKFEPVINWLKDSALKDEIKDAKVSDRLTNSPMALVASSYGWSGNMERIMKAQAYAQSKDSNTDFYSTQKKVLEINPKHPLMGELLSKVEADEEDPVAHDLARVMYETATLRSGYLLEDSAGFATRIERMLKLSMNIDIDAQAEEWPEFEEDEADEGDEEEEEEEEEDEEIDVEELEEMAQSLDDEEKTEDHDEL